jgi:hypothetical protein
VFISYRAKIQGLALYTVVAGYIIFDLFHPCLLAPQEKRRRGGGGVGRERCNISTLTLVLFQATTHEEQGNRGSGVPVPYERQCNIKWTAHSKHRQSIKQSVCVCVCVCVHTQHGTGMSVTSSKGSKYFVNSTLKHYNEQLCTISHVNTWDDKNAERSFPDTENSTVKPNGPQAAS